MSDFPYVATGIVLGTLGFFIWRLSCWIGNGVIWLFRKKTEGAKQ